MRLLLLDPFHTGSHSYWSNELTERLNARGNVRVELRTLKGRHWKWRMIGSAATFASALQTSDPAPDVILTTDMMDVAALRGLLPAHWCKVQIILYFHENQLTYPWSPNDPDTRGLQSRTYGFVNIQSALAADFVWFNSEHHKNKFLDAMRSFLAQMPDYKLPHAIESVRAKSSAMPIGIINRPSQEPLEYDPHEPNKIPALLWNHRWEYDKGPDRFFNQLQNLAHQGYPFKLILLGQQFDRMPVAWKEIHVRFEKQILHSGWVASQKEYQSWLRKSDFILHDPRQEYFGISVLEAMLSGVIPLVSSGHAYDDWMPQKFIHKNQVSLEKQLDQLSKNRIQNRKEAISIATQFEWNIVIAEYERKLEALAS